MKTQIDLKSLLCGLGIGVLTMLAIGATTSAPLGKFQIAGGPPMFLLVDTTTGKVWTANFNAAVKTTDADFFEPKEGK